VTMHLGAIPCRFFVQAQRLPQSCAQGEIERALTLRCYGIRLPPYEPLAILAVAIPARVAGFASCRGATQEETIVTRPPELSEFITSSATPDRFGGPRGCAVARERRPAGSDRARPAPPAARSTAANHSINPN